MNNRLGLLGCSLFLLATLTACSGGGGGSSSTAAPPPANGNGSDSPPPTNNNATGFAYVAHIDARAFSAFTINATTGALSEVAGSPFAVDPWYPGSLYITVHPSGKFVYVVNNRLGTEGPHQPSTVSAYAINASTGALSEVAGSPFTAGDDANCLKIDPSGKFAYVTNSVSRNVSAYAINATTGALSEIAGSPFAVGNTTTASMAIHPSGKFAYLANYGNPGTITAYAINAATGALTSIGTTAGAILPLAITVDPSGKFAYLTDRGELSTIFGGVLAYKINATTGALSQVTGSPLVEGRGPQSVAVDPSGKFAYVAHPGGVVSAFTINATTGAWSEIAGSPYAAGSSPLFVTVDDSGRFVYVINSNGNSNGVFGFTINTTTGELSSPGELATFNNSVTYITANRRSQ